MTGKRLAEIHKRWNGGSKPPLSDGEVCILEQGLKEMLDYHRIMGNQLEIYYFSREHESILAVARNRGLNE